MTDEEYKEFLNDLARKHFQPSLFRHPIEMEEVVLLINRLSAAGRLNQVAADRPDSKELRDVLVGELNRTSISPAVDVMDRAGVIDALEEGASLVFENLRRSAIPAEDVALMRVRIPAKLNADSEDAERGFRASRTRLGAKRRSVAVS